jgi:hypothetical protein
MLLELGMGSWVDFVLDWTKDWMFDRVSRLAENELTIAVIWGTVAASFIVEQVGLPVMTTREDGTEMWNGDLVRDRVKHLEGIVGNQ